MLSAIFLMVVLVLALSVAAPVVARQIQLDREHETMERGKQYRRAIQLYYRQFRAYPPSIDALVEASNIRFLRKQYRDPMTGKDDWLPILFGQNRTPTAMGFFGRPSGGVGSEGLSTVAGTGRSGVKPPLGGWAPGAAPDASFDSGFASSPSSAILGPGNSGSIFASFNIEKSSNSGNGSSSLTGGGQSGQLFGGTGIIGFSPGCARQSVMIYKKKDQYNEWEFTYGPLTDSTLGNNSIVQQSRNLRYRDWLRSLRYRTFD